MGKRTRTVIEVIVVAILVVVAILYVVHDGPGTSGSDQTNFDEMEVTPS